MTQLNDISLAFDDIIDTPAKRRRQVEEASQQLRQRYAQSQLPFSLLRAVRYLFTEHLAGWS